MGRVDGQGSADQRSRPGSGAFACAALAAEGADIIAVDICADIETNEYPLARPEDLDETARLVEKEGRRVHTEIADVRDRAGTLGGDRPRGRRVRASSTSSSPTRASVR